ncbi:hypothetical protein RRG08_037972 [Elysia crispata]|uniref:Uncharacterized protein n=1 Tax=Elysia crispata TaxID=231223 RepID=A0AAE1ACI7_9GAST|nr:hypothetical protein RRG08_037972 [Elysia crispata]
MRELSWKAKTQAGEDEPSSSTVLSLINRDSPWGNPETFSRFHRRGQNTTPGRIIAQPNRTQSRHPNQLPLNKLVGASSSRLGLPHSSSTTPGSRQWKRRPIEVLHGALIGGLAANPTVTIIRIG